MQLSVLVETVDGGVHAFDALSGEKLWRTQAGPRPLVTTSMAHARRRASGLEDRLKAAVVPGVDGHLYSIKPGVQVTTTTRRTYSQTTPFPPLPCLYFVRPMKLLIQEKVDIREKMMEK